MRAVRDAFRIEGLGLFDARAARAPGCADSAVAGMTWCGGGTNYVTAENGTYTRSLGYNVDAAGRVVYIILTRKEFPLARADFDGMLRTLGARYGRPPTTLTFQGKTTEGEDVYSQVAYWGGIKLVRLNDAELRAVAEGRATGLGPLVDHRQDARRSARQRDPVYKIVGTAGFIAEFRSVTDVRTDVVLRAVFQPAFTGEPAAKPDAVPNFRILPLDPPLAYALDKIRVEQERLAAIERARRAEEERKAAEERARREEAERKAAELRRIEAERKAAEERRLAEERRVEEERKAAIERKAAEERARREEAERAAEEERVRRAEAERKAAEERRAMEEKARREAAERKAAEERARREEAERKAAEARRIAEERARREEAERKAAEERRVIEERFRRAEAEYKATVERARRAEAERKAAEERAQQAETERKAAEDRAKRIEAERKAAEERRAEERAQERRAEERRITEERARREEAERKAAAERAQREDAERKAAESKPRGERQSADDRARRNDGDRADAAPRQAEPVRTPPPASDRPKPEARRIAEEPRPPETKIAGVAPGVGGPASGREEWLRMAIAQSRNSTVNWVLERIRDRISDDVLVQARAVFPAGDRLALEIAFDCNIDAGKRLKAYVRAFDARTNAAIPIPPEDGRTSVARGSVVLDEDAPQTAFMFPERDERQASIVEIPVTDDDIRKNTPRAQVWLRHFRVALKFRVAQGEASATIYPYSENLRRALEACSP